MKLYSCGGFLIQTGKCLAYVMTDNLIGMNYYSFVFPKGSPLKAQVDPLYESNRPVSFVSLICTIFTVPSSPGDENEDLKSLYLIFIFLLSHSLPCYLSMAGVCLKPCVF